MREAPRCARCGHPNSHSEEDGPCDYIVGFAVDSILSEPNWCYCPAFVPPAEQVIPPSDLCERIVASLAPPPCEECEWYLTHTDGGQHAKALHVEIAEMRAFHDKILEAWDYSQAGGKGSKNPIIRGRKLYRLVRETIEQEAALAPKGGK